MRLVGILLLLSALAVGAIGALWIIFALLGEEWDFCRGNDCIAGEIMGFTLLAIGSLVALLAVRLSRSR